MGDAEPGSASGGLDPEAGHVSARIALGIEYDGSRFHGWQTQQPGVRTVQEVLERGLSAVADHPVRVVCAGRTDTGVHALGQVVHFDSSAARSQRAWVLGTNTRLPDDVRVLWAQQVAQDFHARFSAVGRRYSYLIQVGDVRPAVLRRRLTWIHRPLDVARMARAALPLLGRHDFSSYRAVGCQAKSPVRTLRELQLTAPAPGLVRLDLEADAFLHHMVRNIAGVLIAIGQGDRPEGWAAEVLALRDRTLGGVTAPPDGLYLTGVEYPLRFAVGSTRASTSALEQVGFGLRRSPGEAASEAE